MIQILHWGRFWLDTMTLSLVIAWTVMMGWMHFRVVRWMNAKLNRWFNQSAADN